MTRVKPRHAWVVALAICLPIPATVLGQTTATERAAAAEILEQIADLQERLDPLGRARRIVREGNRNRVRVMDRAEMEWDTGLQDLSDWIAAHPEVGWEEHMAVDTLTKVLRSRGWEVTTGVAGLETAFVASWDSPAGPGEVTLGLIGEYDALRDIDGPFHGDQHNAQTPVAMAAAFALQEHLATAGVAGRLRLYGTPAEEVGPPAKTIMHQAGVFSEADILIRSHSSVATARARAGFGVCCLNINEVKYTFLGRPSHQLTSWNGRNALEAAVMFYSAVDGLRSTFRPEASIQGVIPEGGVAPNVVPARAVVDYYIRYPDEVYLEHMNRMIDDAARGAALATGTRVEIDRYGEYRDGITVGTLEELYFAYAQALDAPGIELEAQRPAGYEETGWVTRDIPGVGVSVYSSRGSYHTKGMAEDASSEVGHTGFRADARIMAAILFDFLNNRDLRDAVAQEHSTLKGLLDDYHERLRETYGPEISRVPVGGS